MLSNIIMRNDTIYFFDSTESKDMESLFGTLDSKDLNQLVSIIRAEQATNSNLTSAISALSIIMSISILFNVILLYLNNKKSNKLKKTNEPTADKNKKINVRKEGDSQKEVYDKLPDSKQNTTHPNSIPLNEKKQPFAAKIQIDTETKTENENNINKSSDVQKELLDKTADSKQSTIRPNSIPQDETKQPSNSRIRCYTETKSNKLLLFGMSLQGRGHIDDNVPCQDYHMVEILDVERNIGIAVVSDGAGSAKKSAEGSQIVCESSIKYLKMAIEKLQWGDLNNLPDEMLWRKVIREVIRLVQIDLNEKAKSLECELRSLAATFILLYFTPERSYFAHVGDGRAGVKTSDGWKSILTPHKGEESNQTVFVSNEILSPADLTISGVSVPEIQVIETPISAFILMSDGCEEGLWIKNKREDLPDGDFRYVQLNQPFSPAIDKLVQVIQDKRYDNQREDVLFQFMDRYNENLKVEVDDKTICLGIIE